MEYESLAIACQFILEPDILATVVSLDLHRASKHAETPRVPGFSPAGVNVNWFPRLNDSAPHAESYLVIRR